MKNYFLSLYLFMFILKINAIVCTDFLHFQSNSEQTALDDVN